MSQHNAMKLKSHTNESLSVQLHCVLLVIGSVFVLAPAFHSNIWFDDAYSIAISQHSFSEIWSIGAQDVHPVLYYFLEHIIILIFGPNIVILRVFAALGFIALATLGLTHVRRDFGAQIGVLFSVLVLFAPATTGMATQIRMYSWAAFVVGFAAVYAWRIAQRVCECTDKHAIVPLRWWIALFVSSVAAAYLHYFAAMAAFVLCALVLVVLVAHRHGHRSELCAFSIGATCAIVCYVPWLIQLAGQVSFVSSGFWVGLSFMSLIKIGTFPLIPELILSSAISFRGSPALLVPFVVAFICWALLWVHDIRDLKATWAECDTVRSTQQQGTNADHAGWAQMLTHASKSMVRDPAVCAAFVVFAVGAISLIAGEIIGQSILYYRYLYVCLGPALFAGAVLLARAQSRVLVVSVLTSTIVLSCMSLYYLMPTLYNSENAAAPAYYEELVASVAEANDSDEALVVTEDIDGIAGVFAVLKPDISITYLDNYAWGSVRGVFSPTITIVEDWSILDGTNASADAVSSDNTDADITSKNEDAGSSEGFIGTYVLLSGDGESGAEEFAAEHNSVVISSITFVNPYHLQSFTISVLERTG